ncbi:MAG: ABC transporter permease [Acidobacteria bacterium]|nr:ABC transporter permease [Acidobacteriota bacterium]
MLLGYELWRDRYGSSPDIIGKPIRANGVSRSVIGVMPERFAFPIREAVWIPLPIDPLATVRGQGPNYQAIAKLKPSVSLAQATAQAATIASQLEME